MTENPCFNCRYGCWFNEGVCLAPKAFNDTMDYPEENENRTCVEWLPRYEDLPPWEDDDDPAHWKMPIEVSEDYLTDLKDSIGCLGAMFKEQVRATNETLKQFGLRLSDLEGKMKQ